MDLEEKILKILEETRGAADKVNPSDRVFDSWAWKFADLYYYLITNGYDIDRKQLSSSVSTLVSEGFIYREIKDGDGPDIYTYWKKITKVPYTGHFCLFSAHFIKSFILVTYESSKIVTSTPA